MPKLHVMKRFALAAGLCAAVFTLNGCVQPIEAIALSNSSLDFGLNQRPIFIDVWNSNPRAGALEINVFPSAPWIITDVNSVDSAPPAGAGGPFDKRSIQVSIDRRQLSRGTHTGNLTFTARGVFSVTLPISVRQDTDGATDTLSFGETGVTPEYAAPYLVDFHFSLLGPSGNAVIAEPELFTVEASEDDRPIGAESGVTLRRTAARQLKLELLLDYTLSMQLSPGAIAAMQNAAISTLLPELNEDAQIGVTEFHRDDRDATVVAPFSVDHGFIANRIQAIQSQVVQGFFSGSRMHDAIGTAVREFDGGDPATESRYVLLFSDGNDTSSTAAANEAIAAAVSREVRVFAIGFGNDPDVLGLQNLTTQTGGRYFSAADASELGEAFAQIVDELQSQYTLRWATLSRGGASFVPSFTLRLGGDSIFYLGPRYTPSQHVGNVLEGVLRVVPSSSATNTTVFLRAEYMPRFVSKLRIFIDSDFTFTLRQVGFADDGLVAGWSVDVQPDLLSGGEWVTLQSSGAPLPFGAFGPLLRIDFAGVVPEGTPLFTDIHTDNTIYPNGQSFVVDGLDG